MPMSQTLLFRFQDSDRFQWQGADGRGRAAAPAGEGPAAQLAALAAGRRLVLAAPGAAVTLTQTRAPGRNRTTWLKALPYALEDHLAEDVDELHFAVGRTRGDQVPVAILRRDTLDGWLRRAAAAGLAPVAVVPDTLLLPLEDGAWSLLAGPGEVLVRTGPHSGFACDRDTLGLLLALALEAAGEDRPTALRIWGDLPAQGLPPDLEIRPQPSAEPLALLAAGYRPADTLNLLQGGYSRRAHLGRWLRPWRAAAVLAALWLASQLGALAVEYLRLGREETQLRLAMEQLYRDTVPGTQRVVNPRVQLANRLRELSRATQGGPAAGFLDLLYQGGQTLNAFQGVTLKGLRYRDSQLDLDLEGNSLEVLDTFKQRLTEQPGLEALMRTSKRDDRIESQVTLRKGAS